MFHTIYKTRAFFIFVLLLTRTILVCRFLGVAKVTVAPLCLNLTFESTTNCTAFSIISIYEIRFHLVSNASTRLNFNFHSSFY